jgi:hypothetical protein
MWPGAGSALLYLAETARCKPHARRGPFLFGIFRIEKSERKPHVAGGPVTLIA